MGVVDVFQTLFYLNTIRVRHDLKKNILSEGLATKLFYVHVKEIQNKGLQKCKFTLISSVWSTFAVGEVHSYHSNH
jgi:hypothetical protein